MAQLPFYKLQGCTGTPQLLSLYNLKASFLLNEKTAPKLCFCWWGWQQLAVV